MKYALMDNEEQLLEKGKRPSSEMIPTSTVLSLPYCRGCRSSGKKLAEYRKN
ncbi:Hypothetical protein LDBND_1751 [Lactobacillus delbrueckii subsp. bulgaricus ND02]|nr:Hypothetical protein LDBND_1751 [Lactobacillus delbrueckii subsp. bulgaricus ND02]